MIGGLAEDRRDHEDVDADAEERAQPERHQGGSQNGQPYTWFVVDRVHAEHDQVHVDDPHDVDDAEDEVQAEGEEGQDAAQQDAVDRGLGQEDRVDHRPTYAFRTNSLRSAAAAPPS